jgi:hypothetical protein
VGAGGDEGFIAGEAPDDDVEKTADAGAEGEEEEDVDGVR